MHAPTRPIMTMYEYFVLPFVLDKLTRDYAVWVGENRYLTLTLNTNNTFNIDILVWQYLPPQQIYSCSKVISEQNQLNH